MERLFVLKTFVLFVAALTNGQAPSTTTAPTAVTTPLIKECDFSLEVMHVQDLSSSFYDDIPLLETKLVEVLQLIEAKYPTSRFGMATFTDKPIHPFGYPEQPGFDGDWCLNVTDQIGGGGSINGLVNNMLQSGIGGGKDWPENQLGAMHDIARHPSLAGWSNDTHDANGNPIVRVMVVSTDAIYHKGDPSHGLNPNPGTGSTNCTHDDYPTISQLRDALVDGNIYTIFLLGNHTGEDLVSAYEELLNILGTEGGVYELKKDSSDIVDKMSEALDEMEEKTCLKKAVDMVYSVDVTYSYKTDLPNFRNLLQVLTGKMQNAYINPRYGLTTFGDKPISPFGHGPSGDYCYKLHQPLTFDAQLVHQAAAALTHVSGIDWPESQLDGLISSVLDGAIDWRPGATWKGYDLFRIVALTTDAGFHVAGDAAKKNVVLAPHSGGMVKCLIEDYPGEDLVAQALVNKGVHPLFVATSDIAFIYHAFLQRLYNSHGIIGQVVELKDFGDLPTAIISGTRRLLSRILSARKRMM